jgi:hypothetical protein
MVLARAQLGAGFYNEFAYQYRAKQYTRESLEQMPK